MLHEPDSDSATGLASTATPPALEAAEADHFFDVTTEDFEEQVIKRSHEVPVVVDFWADWCAPCRMLGPVLEKTVNDHHGRILLAKVDTDKEQRLAQRFRISGIPAVKAFYKGRVVNEFVGAKDPRFLASFLQSLIPSPAAEAMSQATRLFGERDFAGAAALLKPLVSDAPGVEADKQAQLRIMLAEIYLGLGAAHYAEVGPLLDGLDSRSQEAERGELLRQVLTFFENAKSATGDETERLERDPKDAAAHFTLAAALAADGKYEAAFDHLLWLVANNRRFGDDSGRKSMLALFQYLGSDHPAVHEARRRLQVIL